MVVVYWLLVVLDEGVGLNEVICVFVCVEVVD